MNMETLGLKLVVYRQSCTKGLHTKTTFNFYCQVELVAIMCGNLSQFHPNLSNSMGEIARLEKLTELVKVLKNLWF